MKTLLIGMTIAACFVATSLEAQEKQAFIGSAVGIATLSPDAASEPTPAGADLSLYKPENGPAVNLLFGVHVHQYVTVQANYIWNRNDLVLVSARDTVTGPAFYEQPFRSAQHAVVGDLLLYFRERASAVRPYLSVGAGALRLQATATTGGRAINAIAPTDASATRPVLRVAVGLDLALGRGWSARYSFSESICGNPIGAQLSPRGQAILANFQNLFGLVRTL
jgi:hypothetical protein